MLLKDFVIPRSKIALPGKLVDGEKPHFLVRGLCLEDMTLLVQEHIGPISRALKLYQESRQDVLKTGNLQGFILMLARDFPDLVAEVISAAADQLDDATRKVAKTLPVATQIMALSEIAKLTLEDAGGLKNLLAEMQTQLQKAVSGVESEDAPLARPELN